MEAVLGQTGDQHTVILGQTEASLSSVPFHSMYYIFYYIHSRVFGNTVIILLFRVRRRWSVLFMWCYVALVRLGTLVG